MLSVLPLGVLTAQEEKDYLPKAGDWAIGIDMQPVYRYIGNFANGYGTNGAANTLNQFGGEESYNLNNLILGNNVVSIMGKYMLDNTTAIRINMGMGKVVSNDYEYSIDDKAVFENPLSEAKVEDYKKRNAAQYSIAAGIEFRKGKNRIQGYYGGDLVFVKIKDHYNMSYGNAVTELNQTPHRNNYNATGLGIPNPDDPVPGLQYWTRTYLTESYENRIIFGLAGKLGVEYFIAPKLSLGGEVSLLLAKDSHKGEYTKSEGYNPTTERVETHTELVNPRDSKFYLGTTNMGGKLFMLFYF